MNCMNPLTGFMDRAVRGEISDDALARLSENLEGSPVIAKYDPEDFHEDGISTGEILSVLEDDLIGAVQIGGSGDSVTNGNMNTAFSRIQEANEEVQLPVLMEPGKTGDMENGGLDSDILTEPDIFNKPRVYNTGNAEWITGHHRKFQRMLNSKLDEKAEEMIDGKIREKLQDSLPGYTPFREALTDRVAGDYVSDIGEDGARALARQAVDSSTVTEAYYVVNPDSTVAEITDADQDILSMDYSEMVEDARGVVSDLAQDGYEGIIYIESSGALAPPELVEEVKEEIDLHGIQGDTLLAYGGGIGGTETVDRLVYGSDIAELPTEKQIDAYLENGADTVIVGNSFQEKGKEALN